MKKYNTLKTCSGKSWKTAKFVKIASLLIAAVYMVAAVSLDASAAITGKISGVITAETTNEPLANVTVTIVGTSSTATTNAAGYTM